MDTKPIVTINLLNNEAQGDTDWGSSSRKQFSDLNLLNNFSKDSPEFADLSLNDFVLDSSLGNEIRNIAFMSSELSDEDCMFNNVWVSGEFHNVISFYNLTLEFGENYPKKIRIDYKLNGAVTDTEEIDEIESSIIYTKHSLLECDGVKLTFIESWSPYRYANLQSFLIGSILKFDSSRIVSLTLSEDTDPSSNKLEVDEATIKIIHDHNEFDLLNPTNISKYLVPGTMLEIRVEIKDGDFKENEYIGRYYINGIKFDANVFMELKCETFLGLMKNVKYYKSEMYNGELPISSAKNIIDSIFNEVFDNYGIPRGDRGKYYELDSELEDIRCYGYIKPTDCCDALRQICFINGLSVNDSRRTNILIKRTDFSEIYDEDDPDHEIGLDRINEKVNFEITNDINELHIPCHVYSISSETSERVVNESGLYMLNVVSVITETIPEEGHTASEYTIEVGALYFKIEYHSEPFEVTVVYREYKDELNEVIVRRVGVDKSEKDKFVNINDSNLFTEESIKRITNDVYGYLVENNLKLEMKYFNDTQTVGEKMKVELNGKSFYGYLTHQSVDVSKGMLTRCEIIGKRRIKG